jgi:CheY-like chemotaxis protein
MCTSAQTGKPRRGGFMIGTRGIKRQRWTRFHAHSGLHFARFVSEMMDAISSTRPPPLPSDVLIVEDDPIIALDFEDTILGLGVKQVRTAGNVAKALDMIADRAPDFALLDVSLIREKSFAVAERLEALQIPFAFVTGYGADKVPPEFADRPRLPKPCSREALLIVLQRFARKR